MLSDRIGKYELGRGVKLEVLPGDIIVTRFPDGREVTATRPFTPDNAAEAIDQGYAGDEEGVWQSLLDHEVLHTLIGRVIWNSEESLVLRHEAGGEHARYALRLYEEAVVISFQRWLNTGMADKALQCFDAAEAIRLKTQLAAILMGRRIS